MSPYEGGRGGGFRGGGGGGGGFRGRGGGGGRGFGGGRGGGRGGFNNYDQGPPEHVVPLGDFSHTCEEEIVCKCTNEKVPYFNAPVYLENKQQIGKVEEIFGPIKDFYFSVKLSENMNASSFKKTEKFFIDPMKLLPLSRFLPQPGGARGRGGGGGGRGRGGDRGRGRGRGGGFGGRGGGGFRGRGGGGGGFRGGRGGGGFRGGRGGY